MIRGRGTIRIEVLNDASRSSAEMARDVTPATAAWATGHAAVRTRPRADRKIGATLATTVR